MRRLFTLALLATAAAAQEDVDALLREGVALYQRGEYDAAVQRFARVRQVAPEDWRGHTWQAFTLLAEAAAERDAKRRAGLVGEARALMGPLVKEAGVLFQDPLRHYLLAVAASVEGKRRAAYRLLATADSAPAHRFTRYRDIRLRDLVTRALGHESIAVAVDHVLRGEFSRADPLLRAADEALAEDDPARRDLERHRAVVDEALGRFDSAVARLRRCIELFDDRPRLQTEFRATIALVYFKAKRVDAGLEALAGIPESTAEPEAIAAHCMAKRIRALEDPESDAMDGALAYHRDALDRFPVREAYRLAEGFAELVCAKVGPRDVERERALVDEAIALLEHERRLHPECPPLYWHLAKLYRLANNEAKAEELEKLHARKKKEYEKKLRFDARGRPRCG